MFISSGYRASDKNIYKNVELIKASGLYLKIIAEQI